MQKALRRGRPLLVVEVERELKEVDSLGGDVRRDLWFGGHADLRNGLSAPAPDRSHEGGAAHLEYGLHLRELRPRVFAGEHLDDETADAPDVRLVGVRGLLHDLGCHPEHGALQGRPVCLIAYERYRHHVQNGGFPAPGQGSLTSTRLLGDTEVRDLDAALVVDEDVSALDVAVDDVPRV